MRAAVAAVIALVTAAVAAAQSRDIVTEVFRTQADIERRMLAIDVTNLERTQEELSAATDRLLRLGADLLRAQREGEDSGAFAARTADLGRAEAEVARLIADAQQLRAAIGARRIHLEQLQAELRRLQESAQARGDELSGRWNVVVEPGNQRGVFDLKLDGTLVTGTYDLAGGWQGSLRGTFINGNLRLERIDAQLGFVAVLTGRLVQRGGEARLEGGWEGTNLAAGMPTSGAWVARRPAGS